MEARSWKAGGGRVFVYSCAAQLARLVAALADGAESATLSAAIREREALLRDLDAQLSAVHVAPLAFDRARLKRELSGRVREWKTLLRKARNRATLPSGRLSPTG